MNVGDTKVTYRRKDGELIAGEYGWVDGPEWFEDDDSTEYVKETWRLISWDVVTLPPEPEVEDDE